MNMDTIDSGDLYLNYFPTDKPHSDTEVNILQSDGGTNLDPIEPMFTDIGDGTLAWTIDGYSILMNTDSTKNTTEEVNIENIEQDTPNNSDVYQTQSDITTNEVLLSNEVLLQLSDNLQLHNENENEISTNLIESTKDPIINGSVLRESKDNCHSLSSTRTIPNILRHSRSILKSSVKESVANSQSNVGEMIEEIKAYQCVKCSYLSECYDDIAAHIKSLHVAKPATSVNRILDNKSTKESSKTIIYLCGICANVGYPSTQLLKQHMINVHDLVPDNEVKSTLPVSASIQVYDLVPDTDVKKSVTIKNPCDPNNVIRNYQLYVQQQRKSVAKIRCTIKYCESRFTNDDIRLKHEQCHIENEVERFECPECHIKFSLWKLCSSHLWSRHKIDIGLHSCPVCQKYKAISSHAVLNHLASHSNQKPCLCNICGKRFKSNAQLRNHLSKNHENFPNEIPKEACSICDRNFANKKSLKKHVQDVHNKIKPFICNICGHKSARKAMLEMHLRQHTGEKPYACEFCAYRSADHNTLRRHLMRHAGTAKYKCEYCDYTAIQTVAFKNHMVKNHPGKTGLYTCLLCRFRFINEENFKMHMNDHRMGLIKVTPSDCDADSTIIPTCSPKPLNIPQNSKEQSKSRVEEDESTSSTSPEESLDTGGFTIPEFTDTKT